MKLSQRKLKQIIKEEIQKTLKERDGHALVLTEAPEKKYCESYPGHAQMMNSTLEWLMQIDAKLNCISPKCAKVRSS